MYPIIPSHPWTDVASDPPRNDPAQKSTGNFCMLYSVHLKVTMFRE